MMLLAILMAFVAAEPADSFAWKKEPEAVVEPRSFMCSLKPKGISYIVVAKTPEQNFVDFWEKYTGDVEPLKMRVKGATELATVGDERFLITSVDEAGDFMRLELWPDTAMGLKGQFTAKVGNRQSNGECSLIAMIPGYENLK